MDARLSRRDFFKLAGVAAGSILLSGYDWKAAETPSREEFLAAHEIFHGDRSRRIVLMTYDDQISAGRIPIIESILDEYKKRDARATFFLNGIDSWNLGLDSYSDLIKRMIAEGHTFGSHSWKHDAHTELDEEEAGSYFQNWLDSAARVVPDYKVRFLRFPYGDRNPSLIRLLASYGLQSVMWEIESGGMGPETIDNVESGVGSFGGGWLVLSHMTRPYDVAQAGKILDMLIGNGYHPVSLEEGISPDDDWERKAVVPFFPGRYKPRER
jgi:peptidoglycan/xylan/chitin deacetylase (PgdA/CDA1 family)